MLEAPRQRRWPPVEAAKILPFMLSFGGLSVCCQVEACFEEDALPWGRLLMGRLLHGTLTALLAAPWLGRAAGAGNDRCGGSGFFGGADAVGQRGDAAAVPAAGGTLGTGTAGGGNCYRKVNSSERRFPAGKRCGIMGSKNAAE